MENLIHPAGWSGGQHEMAAPYSLDLRERVVAAAAAGQPYRRIAKVFCIAPSTVSTWTRRLRETGSPAALPMGGKRPFSLAQHRDWVLARVAAKPDITLSELKAELKDRGVKVSVFAIWHFLRRDGVSFKNVWPAPLQAALSIRPCQSASTYPAYQTLPWPRWRSARSRPS
jgi:transposase